MTQYRVCLCTMLSVNFRLEQHRSSDMHITILQMPKHVDMSALLEHDKPTSRKIGFFLYPFTVEMFSLKTEATLLLKSV